MIFGLLGLISAHGYDLIVKDGHTVSWNPGTIPLRLQLGSALVLSDNSTYNTSVQSAFQAWNLLLETIQFSDSTGAPAAPLSGNNVNEVGFDSTVYGTAFDPNVLAVTVSYYATTPRSDGTYVRTQSDIIFNSAYPWDSYRGTLRVAEDIQRVALHELGHVLGLNHPDQASPPQFITALMNSQVSNLDALASDDITGGQFLYGQRKTVPSITGQPAPVTLLVGQSGQFSVTANGYPTPTFQWQRLPAGTTNWSDLNGGTTYAGTTTVNLTVSATTVAMSGDLFRCVASSSEGAATSSPAMLTVTAPILAVITATPESVLLDYGGTISLAATVIGTAPISLQWTFNGTPLTGETSNTLIKAGATPADGGAYTVTATNAAGSVTGRSIAVVVNPANPVVITGLPSAVTLDYGERLQLVPTVSGTLPITFQWRKNGLQFGEPTSGPLLVNSTTPADSGTYTLAATNHAGTTISSAVPVTVRPPVAPTISALPAAITLDYGSELSIAPTLTGSLPLTYQWSKGGIAIPGATQKTLSITNATPATSGIYTLTATNLAGTTVSSIVTVTIRAAQTPTVTGLPSALTLKYGDALTLVPAVAGTAPLEFVWRKDGIPIAGATSGSFHKAYAVSADSGVYSVTVTNVAGTTVSSAVAVTVQTPEAPTISSSAMEVPVILGSPFLISVAASGTPPLSFKWYKDGVPTGIGLPFYDRPFATMADGAVYTVTVSNDYGSASGPNITVIIKLGPPPTITKQPGKVVTVAGSAIRLTVAATGLEPITARWKYNGATLPGETNLYLDLPNIQARDAGSYTVDLTNANGMTTSDPAVIELVEPTGVVSASSGGYHGLFVRCDGTLWSFGDNSSGQLGDSGVAVRGSPVLALRDVARAIAGPSASFFIRTDSSLWGVGDNREGQMGDGTWINNRPTPVQLGTGIVAASAGFRHAMFISTDGTLWGSGANVLGQLGVTEETVPGTRVRVANRVKAVATGANHTLYITASGQLWGAGRNSSGQLGLGGTVNVSTPYLIASGVVQVAAGQDHSLFVDRDGRLFGMGYNAAGQLGDGTMTNRILPVEIAGGVQSAAAGINHSLFVKRDGTVWAMGANYSGQLGDGTTTLRTVPVKIASGAIAVAAGDNQSLFITSDGTLWSMGTGVFGQNGTGLFNFQLSPLPIASGPISIPQAPRELRATNGTAADGVRLNWDRVAGASGYELWRSLTPDPALAVRIEPFVADPLYYDSAAAPLTAFFYFVRAINPAGASGFTGPTAGLVGTFAADFNADGKPDLIWSNSKTGERALWLMNGTNFLSASTLGVFPLEWTIAATGDFNADGKPDLVWSNSQTGERALWLMNGTNLLAVSTLGVFPLEWTVAATADFNVDGKPDLIWSNSLTGERAIWLMSGTNFLSSSTLGIFPLEWTVAATGDFNADGKPDLIWSNSVTGERALWLMDGTTRIGVSTLGLFPLEWTVAGTADFNADGKPDIIWSNSVTGERALWLMNGTQFLGASTLGLFPLEWTVSN